ncbi:unnamed protein product [Rhizophagus irregularis]|nr:unnamed protein product [Rhizophagus irregularis]
MTSVKEWVEEKIKNKYIQYFEYDKFSQIVEIDRGGFGKVSKANLANTGLVALKIIFSKNSNIGEYELIKANYELVKELELLREIDYRQNINRILGITKDGHREESIKGTPLKYQRLYHECWDGEPKSRPDIEEVHEILCQLNTEKLGPEKNWFQ